MNLLATFITVLFFMIVADKLSYKLSIYVMRRETLVTYTVFLICSFMSALLIVFMLGKL
jgi:hypothetical protein